MLRTGNYLHHQSHTDWYSILCADDMHKPWLFSLPLAKGLDYTLLRGCEVIGEQMLENGESFVEIVEWKHIWVK